MSTFNKLEAVFAPKLIITLRGTLQAQAVFKDENKYFILVKTSDETLMEKLLKIKMHTMHTIVGDYKQEPFVNSTGETEYGGIVTAKSINCHSAQSNKPLLLLLYKHAINNYYSRILVIAYAPLDLVNRQFEILWDLLSPLNTFKSIEHIMPENMKKECKEHTKKTLEYVDKLATLCLSSDN